MQKQMHTPEQLAALSDEVTDRLLWDAHLRQAETVLAYHALADEVNTERLLEWLLAEGKTVLLPRVTGEESMELCRYTGPQDLLPGFFSISEPTGEPYPPSSYSDIDLAIIPGMAFDLQGNRLGRGKGYYDRLLPQLSRAWRIGLCFPFQKLPGIPADAHDIKMHHVIC